MGSGLLFIIRLGYQMSCESLDSLSKNWDSFKGTRRLPCVDPFTSGCDSMLSSIYFNQNDVHNLLHIPRLFG